MRFAYSAHACSAHAGSLAATATTRSLGTCRLFLRRRSGGFHLHFLPAPDFFEVVKGPYGGMHEVHHDLSEVDQHPLAAFFTLDAVDLASVLLHLVAHVVGERLHLPRRVAAGDDDPLEH